jgi:1D-myo-inositol-tetrakisphosphate 5-kinase/inositol-polyphosphate multikinase
LNRQFAGYIKMEDLTYKMERACVMDIKMGTQTWTDDAFYLKKLQLQNKDQNTTSASLGFRITGMRVRSCLIMMFEHIRMDLLSSCRYTARTRSNMM